MKTVTNLGVTVEARSAKLIETLRLLLMIARVMLKVRAAAGVLMQCRLVRIHGSAATAVTFVQKRPLGVILRSARFVTSVIVMQKTQSV